MNARPCIALHLLLATLLLSVFAPAAEAYYSPSTGTFLQRDSMGYTDGMTLYRYGRSNPVRHSDPMGLCSEEAGTKHCWPADTPQDIRDQLGTACGSFTPPPAGTSCHDWEKDRAKTDLFVGSWFRAYMARKKAESISKWRFPDSDECENGMRHCMFSCLLYTAPMISDDEAERVLNAHECCAIHRACQNGTSPDWDDIRRDLEWNEVGRSLKNQAGHLLRWEREARCKWACLRKVRDKYGCEWRVPWYDKPLF